MKAVRIPKERVGALIGKDGASKRMLQERMQMTVRVDTEGEVFIEDEGAKDPVMSLKAVDIIKAIGRGFSPERALRLMGEDEYLEIMDIDDYVGKGHDQLQRMRARVIGTGGKTRRIIEDMSGVDLSVYGDTVAIIGNSIQLPIGRTAVDMVLSGSEHATVYRYLERKRATLKIMEMGFQ
jgi:ribosomal RNA assembly protein